MSFGSLARIGLAALCLVGCVVIGAAAEGTQTEQRKASPLAAPDAAPTVLTAAELTARIDARLAEVWKRHGVEPAALAGDTEFLRRANLDLAGRIPTLLELRDFLRDSSPLASKRRKLVTRLVERPHFDDHWAMVWRDQLSEDTVENYRLHLWLRDRFRRNVGFDRIASELLLMSLGPPKRGRPSLGVFQKNTFGFSQPEPEILAAKTSSVFLGVTLECAQCHDHPFLEWKQEQFWSYAAFFVRPASVAVRGKQSSFAPAEIRIPETGAIVPARFFDGTAPDLSGQEPIDALAAWMTAPGNVYFQRTMVNRVWENFFGRPLVEQVDNPDDLNTPLGKLLDIMAQQFAANRFRFRYLARAIALSRAYQLSSDSGTMPSQTAAYFARMPVRRLSADQLYDSILRATAYREGVRSAQPWGRTLIAMHDGPPHSTANSGKPRFVLAGTAEASVILRSLGNSPGAELRRKFAEEYTRRTEADGSLTQALSLMHGPLVGSATSLETGQFLSAVLDARDLDKRSRVEAIYLATLCRKPRGEELARLESFLHSTGPVLDERVFLADLLWTLINSTEFITNH